MERIGIMRKKTSFFYYLVALGMFINWACTVHRISSHLVMTLSMTPSLLIPMHAMPVPPLMVPHVLLCPLLSAYKYLLFLLDKMCVTPGYFDKQRLLLLVGPVGGSGAAAEDDAEDDAATPNLLAEVLYGV
jgi:hypothetical protein